MAKLLPVQYGKILYQLTKEANESDIKKVLRAFIEMLHRDQMLNKIEYIINEFEKHAKEEEGIVSLEITSAHDLSKKLVKEIEKMFDGKVELSQKQDASLIGGVVIKHGNTILDGSVKAQLNTIKRELA